MFIIIPKALFLGLRKTLLISAFLALFLLPLRIFAYDYETHGLLTKQTTDFYNQSFSEKIPQELVNFLIDGSRKEDDSPRWINHFYDPVYQRGYQPEIAIDAYPLAFAQTIEKVVNWVSSKQWADSSSQQNRLVYKATVGIYPVASILSQEDKQKLGLSSETDFSWAQAKQYWLKNEKEKAMFALGHVLHLIQDASVPDHTRNDGHISDSPYEKWASKFNLQNPDSGLVKRLTGKQPVVLGDLGSYFESISKYSNNNFYSKDTIGIQSGYKNPVPEYFGKYQDFNVGYFVDGEFGDYPIYINKNPSPFSNVFNNLKDVVLFSDKLNGDFVLSDYWSRLSTKSVQHSAGVINLFFEELKKEKIKDSEQPWYQALWQWLQQQRSSLLGQLLPGESGSQIQESSSIQEDNSGFIEEFPPVLETTVLPETGNFQALEVLLLSPVPTPAPSQSSFSQLGNVQSPNTETETSPSPTPTLEPSPSPTPEPQTPSSSPTPTPTPTPEPQTPSPEPSPVPSPTPEPSPEPNYQHAYSENIDDVAWYFDTGVLPEQGGVLTIEFTVKRLAPIDDFHAIVAAWNTDFIRIVGSKTDGGDRPEMKYHLASTTAFLVNNLDPNFGPVRSLWNYNGLFENASSSFPLKLKIRPNWMAGTFYQLVNPDSAGGPISRQVLEWNLGRRIGTSDFISLAYWPLYQNQTPFLANARFYGSFLTDSSPAVAYPEPMPVNNVKQLRWGVDPSSETGYSVEFEYTWPVQEIYDQNYFGTELRFHLNGEADFYYYQDPNLLQMWFIGNDLSNLVYVNFGVDGSDICDTNFRRTLKPGMRFSSRECSGDWFSDGAYSYYVQPHMIVQPVPQSSWIIKLPIVLIPKNFAELDSSDFITMSLWSAEAGHASGIFLRQIDQRKFYFQDSYQSLSLTPPPAPSVPQVAINEVAWFGTDSSATDEWIELYNNTAEPIDLTGWVLRSQSGPPEINLSGTIQMNSFYLLERTDDSTVSDIPADVIFTGALNNQCEVLELLNSSGELVDKTVCNDTRWPAGDDATLNTMERINPAVSGEVLTNWQTHFWTVSNGMDAGSLPIKGTPKSQNSTPI